MLLFPGRWKQMPADPTQAPNNRSEEGYHDVQLGEPVVYWGKQLGGICVEGHLQELK